MSYKKSIELMDEIRNDLTMIGRYSKIDNHPQFYNDKHLMMDASIKEEKKLDDRIALKERKVLGEDGFHTGILLKELRLKYDTKEKIEKLLEQYNKDKATTEEEAKKLNQKIYDKYLEALSEISVIVEKFNQDNINDINTLSELANQENYLHNSKSKFSDNPYLKGISSILDIDKDVPDINLVGVSTVQNMLFVKENPTKVLKDSIKSMRGEN